MGVLDPKRKERDLLRNFFLGSARMRGTEVTITIPKKKFRDIYNDPIIDEYDDPIEIDIILDQRPDRKMLENLNWFKEGSNTLPLVAYIGSKFPRKDAYLQVIREAIITIPNQMIEDFREDKFVISDIHKTPYYVWMCNLTPYREEHKEDRNEEVHDDDYEIIHAKDKEECDDNYSMLDL